MTPRRIILWLVVLGVVAGIVAIVLHDRFVAGPVYNGGPLNVWLRLLDDPLPDRRDKARQAIRALGPAAVPLITEWLDWKDSLFRRELAAWVARDEDHLAFHPLNPKDRRRLALDACDALGPVAQPMVPKLAAIAIARHPELDAPYLIARIGGSNALPALKTISNSTNKFAHAAADVSTDLLLQRTVLPLTDTYEYAGSEDNEYRHRLEGYHLLVMKDITAGTNDGRR